jgi:hypothetical protein
LTTITKLGSFAIALVLLAALTTQYICPVGEATNNIAITPAGKFNIPGLNSTISFAENGSCSKATLQNDTWIFENLRLEASPDLGLNTSQTGGNLKFSAKNSNITILSYVSVNFSFPLTVLSYLVDGAGTQTVNFGLNSSSAPDPNQWSVIVPHNVFVSEGDGWTLLPDNTLVITHVAQNITIIHYDFTSYLDNNVVFYLQHSVAIGVAATLVIVITLATVIGVRAHRSKKTQSVIKAFEEQ